jgi:hypothetical protein
MSIGRSLRKFREAHTLSAAAREMTLSCDDPCSQYRRTSLQSKTRARTSTSALNVAIWSCVCASALFSLLMARGIVAADPWNRTQHTQSVYLK